MVDFIPFVVSIIFLAVSLSFAFCAQHRPATCTERAIYLLLSVGFLVVGVLLLWI